MLEIGFKPGMSLAILTNPMSSLGIPSGSHGLEQGKYGSLMRFITHLAVLVSLFLSSVPIPQSDSCSIEPGGKGRGAGVINLVGILASIVW